MDTSVIARSGGCTGTYHVPMFVVGGFMLLSAVLMVALSRRTTAAEDTDAPVTAGH